MRGRCTCGEIRFELTAAPLFVHCCHCRWCQRETGGAFALNALIEASEVRLLAGAPVVVDTPSESGGGQKITRCPTCHVALWSVYPGAGPRVRFVRVGTLEDPDALPPDIHIFTGSRQPWVAIPEGAAAVPRYYDRAAHWPAESLARWEACMAAPAPPDDARDDARDGTQGGAPDDPQAGAQDDANAAAVRRIVPNIAAGDPSRARPFYGDMLGLTLAMDLGWIATFTAGGRGAPQVSVLTEGGSGTPVPDISIEVADVDAALRRARAAGFEIVYGPAEEPWGVRRFYVRDPFGTLVNILSHAG